MTMTGGDSLAGPLVAALRDLWAREGYDYVPDPVELAEAAGAVGVNLNLNALPEEREVNRLVQTWEESTAGDPGVIVRGRPAGRWGGWPAARI